MESTGNPQEFKPEAAQTVGNSPAAPAHMKASAVSDDTVPLPVPEILEAAALPNPIASPQAECEPEPEPNTAKKSSRFKSALGSLFCDILDLAESVLAAIFTVLLVFTYLLCTANVEGDSMLPTMADGERLLVLRPNKQYENGDILILDTESAYLFDKDNTLTAAPGLGKTIVKRLIAQSGQEVDIDFDEGIVYVDGVALDEPYTNTLTKRDNRAFTYPLTIPDGYIFVLGDNRHLSKDSRHPEIGLISEDAIIGKVLIRISPFSKFGAIHHADSQ